MTEAEEMAWRAGFFDGEGCILLDRGTVRVSVKQTDPTVLQQFQELYGGWLGEDINTFKARKSGKQLASRAWQWKTNGKDAKKFLIDHLPYFRMKGAQAKIALSDLHWTERKRMILEQRASERQPAIRDAIQSAKPTASQLKFSN